MADIGNTENRGRSYEWGLDVKIGDEFATSPLVKGLTPSFTPKEIDGATYADQGDDHPIKIGETGQLTATIPAVVDYDEAGHFQPDLQAFLDAAAPDATVEERTVTLRYYHDPKDATPNPKLAFEFDAAITAERAQTGTAEQDEWNITAKALGPRRRIPNPAASVTP